MKRFHELIKNIAPILIICLMYLGFFLISRTGNLLYTQLYWLYVAIVLVGCGIIKYSHRDLAMIESKHIALDVKVKSYLFIALIFITMLITVLKIVHLSILVIFYLLMFVLIIELVTLKRALHRAEERELNVTKNPYI